MDVSEARLTDEELDAPVGERCEHCQEIVDYSKSPREIADAATEKALRWVVENCKHLAPDNGSLDPNFNAGWGNCILTLRQALDGVLEAMKADNAP